MGHLISSLCFSAKKTEARKRKRLAQGHLESQWQSQNPELTL